MDSVPNHSVRCNWDKKSWEDKIPPLPSQIEVYIFSYLIAGIRGRRGEQDNISMWSSCHQLFLEYLMGARVLCEVLRLVAHLPDYTQVSQVTLWYPQRVLSLWSLHAIQSVPSSVVALELFFLHCCGSFGHWEPEPCCSGAFAWSLSCLVSSGCSRLHWPKLPGLEV